MNTLELHVLTQISKLLNKEAFAERIHLYEV